MDYISERIINISEMEQLIDDAYMAAQGVRNELAKDLPSLDNARSLAEVSVKAMEAAKDFEFCVEHRRAKDFNPSCYWAMNGGKDFNASQD